MEYGHTWFPRIRTLPWMGDPRGWGPPKEILARGTFLFVFGDNTCHYSPHLLPLLSLLLSSDRKSSRWSATVLLLLNRYWCSFAVFGYIHYQIHTFTETFDFCSWMRTKCCKQKFFYCVNQSKMSNWRSLLCCGHELNTWQQCNNVAPC